MGIQVPYIIPIKRPGHFILGGHLLRCWKTVQKIDTYCKVMWSVAIDIETHRYTGLEKMQISQEEVYISNKLCISLCEKS